MYDAVIVGSGIYGAVFAHMMTKAGKKVLVLEKRKHIGGNVYTSEEDGILLHCYGAHIFHTSNEQVWQFVTGLVPFSPFINSPVALSEGVAYNLPFNMNTFTRLWPGIVTPAEAKAKIDAETSRVNLQEAAKNLKEKALSLVGPTIYNKLIAGYTQKQWGQDPLLLPPEIITRLPLRFTYDNNYFRDPYQGIPIGGYTKLIEALLIGSDVLLEEDFLLKREAWAAKAKTIVYTGPIDAYFDYCYGPLEYRSLRFETERIETDNAQGAAVVNYPDLDVPYTRTIEHKHFTPQHAAELPYTYLTREYPQSFNVSDLQGERYYPVPTQVNQELYHKYEVRTARTPSVIFGGRLAEYKYLDMDKVIARSLKRVKELLKNEP